MTIRILLDTEEAISREVRRIGFFDDRSVNYRVLKDVFDPFTGLTVKVNVEPDFYDTSANTNMIQYPHFFVKLLRMKEDRTTGRVVPQYGNTDKCYITTSPKAFQTIIYQTDGVIAAPGNNLTTSTFGIRKAQPGHLLRLLTGNNVGTYIIATVTPSLSGIHTITVSNTLLNGLPSLLFDSVTRVVNFNSPIDLNTVVIGDTLKDFSSTVFNITAINLDRNSITIDGVTTPNLSALASIVRVGNVFLATDPSLDTFLVMDPTKPVISSSLGEQTTSLVTANPAVPLDLYYLVRIESKERATHIEVANRMWDEFNPPRTGLPTIVRNRNSAEQDITVDVLTGGSNTLTVKDNSGFNVNDPVVVFNKFTPTKDVHGQGFQEVFTAKVTKLIGTTQLVLNQVVPDTFLVKDKTKIVSNADYKIYMFHLQDHVTKDIEGSQYWSHEFTFWIQVWIDRQGEPLQFDGVIQQIVTTGENLDDNTVII